MQSKIKAREVSLTGILAALSTILFIYPHISIFPAPFHIFKLDFADIPALLAGVTVSPVAGIVVVFLRNLVHLFMSDTMFVGELSNFFISSGFVCLASVLIPKKEKNAAGRIVKSAFVMVAAAIFHVLLAALVNYFITFPLYEMLMGVTEEMFGGMKNYIMAGVIPFNAVKAAVNGVVFILVYNALLPKIRRFN